MNVQFPAIGTRLDCFLPDQGTNTNESRSIAWTARPELRTSRYSRYDALIESIFFDYYREGESEFEFARSELESAAESLASRVTLA